MKTTWILCFLLIIFSVVGVLLFFIPIDKDNIQRQIQDEIRSSAEILSIEKISKNQYIALYKVENSVGGVLVRKELFSFNLGVYSNVYLPIDNTEEMSLSFSSDSAIPQSLYIGLVKNPTINTILINDKKARIVEYNNMRIWYFESSERLFPEIKVKGLSLEKELIYEINKSTSMSFKYNDLYIYNQWFLGDILFRNILSKDKERNEVKIAVLDSGVDYNHPDLNQNLLLEGKNIINGTNSVIDNLSHGTKIIGLLNAISNNEIGIVGLAPFAKILPIKVIDKDSKYENNLVKGIEYAIEKEVDIIHISIGTYEEIPSLKRAVEKAYSKGIFIVSSAGNDGIESVTYPARYKSVISVGALDENGDIADFSNFGKDVDVYLPGVNIYSTGFGDGYHYSSGTSYSAALFTGILANLITEKGRTETYNKIINYLSDL